MEVAECFGADVEMLGTERPGTDTAGVETLGIETEAADVAIDNTDDATLDTEAATDETEAAADEVSGEMAEVADATTDEAEVTTPVTFTPHCPIGLLPGNADMDPLTTSLIGDGMLQLVVGSFKPPMRPGHLSIPESPASQLSMICWRVSTSQPEIYCFISIFTTI